MEAPRLYRLRWRTLAELPHNLDHLRAVALRVDRVRDLGIRAASAGCAASRPNAFRSSGAAFVAELMRMGALRSHERWLPSGPRATLCANWMGSVNERKRELWARRGRSAAGVVDSALARALSRPAAESRNAHKPLRILVETNEPRKIALPGFTVNSSVASFRDRNISSRSRIRTYNQPVNSRLLYH